MYLYGALERRPSIVVGAESESSRAKAVDVCDARSPRMNPRKTPRRARARVGSGSVPRTHACCRFLFEADFVSCEHSPSKKPAFLPCALAPRTSSGRRADSEPRRHTPGLR